MSAEVDKENSNPVVAEKKPKPTKKGTNQLGYFVARDFRSNVRIGKHFFSHFQKKVQVKFCDCNSNFSASMQMLKYPLGFHFSVNVAKTANIVCSVLKV